MTAPQQNFPNPAGPFVDPATGVLTNPAQSLLQTLWQRTGSESGEDTSDTALLAQGALQVANSLTDVRSPDRARRALGLTAAAIAATQHGWSTPTGAVSRSALNAAWTGTASAGYTQAELQAAVTQLHALSAILGALIEDLIAYGAIAA